MEFPKEKMCGSPPALRKPELFSKRGLTFRDGWVGGGAGAAGGDNVSWRGKGKSRLLLLSTATTLLLLPLLFILSLVREQCISGK